MNVGRAAESRVAAAASKTESSSISRSFAAWVGSLNQRSMVCGTTGLEESMRKKTTVFVVCQIIY
jgi:hypothetical protein